MFQLLGVTGNGYGWSLPRSFLRGIVAMAVSVVGVVVAQGVFVQSLGAQFDTRPNIVLILADDMGYGDVRALNPESRIATPNLDRLASQGMTFRDAHTPSSVCTPTRYGLLTGRYCWRSSLKRGVLNGYSPPLVEKERMTVAALLQGQGYRTGVVGKWHLGLGFEKSNDGKIDFNRPVHHGPNDLGFEFSLIIPASLDFPPYVYLRNGRVTQPQVVAQPASQFPAFLRRGERAPDLVMEDVLDHLLGAAQAFIRDGAGKPPFFLYFPLTAPHKPVLPHSRFRGQTGLGPYGDFITQVDWTVGQVLKTLNEAGVAENTLVIYTSDNGSFMYRRPSGTDHVDDPTIQAYRETRHRANGPWRGTKADIWEAGHRVPFFARWPGKISPGSHCDTTVCLTDFFATAAAIVDAELPAGAAPDSFSLLELLEGRRPSRKRPAVIHHSVAGMFAIREGSWKLVLGNGSGGREAPRGKPFDKPYHLFDLDRDPSETTNRLSEHPDIAARLTNKFEEILRAAD